MVNGHLTAEIDTAGSDSSYRQRKLLYRNLRGGTFEDVTAISGPALTGLHSSRGAAAADLYNDGRVAIAVNELHERPSLLLPDPGPNHWIGIRLIGSKSNRDALGARVEVETGGFRQIDEVRSGGSYLSQSDLRLHFGLGAASRVENLIVKWPSGAVTRLRNIPADAHIVVEEGSGNWRKGG